MTSIFFENIPAAGKKLVEISGKKLSPGTIAGGCRLNNSLTYIIKVLAKNISVPWKLSFQIRNLISNPTTTTTTTSASAYPSQEKN